MANCCSNPRENYERLILDALHEEVVKADIMNKYSA